MEAIPVMLFVILCLGAYRSSSEILQRQKRRWIIDTLSISEGYKGPFPYSLGPIKIEKDLRLFKIKGQGVDKEPKDVLAIDEDTGEISVKGPVDYEQFKVLKLVFQAYDTEKNMIDTQLGIEIKIIDVNDNPPKFDQNFYSVTIQESTIQGFTLITVRATDSDTYERDGKFDLKIVSVSPEPHDLEFTLEQIQDTEIGTISFKGCLDHETAEKYTIIVEAKDQGKEQQLSSSCTVTINIEDGNNHLPVIKGQTGPGRVKEGEENVLVSRLQVSDEDTRGSAAWRAKFKIDGDTRNNFNITTNPETNEGLLYVKKPLNYEDGPMKNVTIIVENEIPYHSCKVESRSSTGLWKVVTTGAAGIGVGVVNAGVAGGVAGGVTGTGISALSVQVVTVTVDDVNEAPIFVKSCKAVTLGENVKAGRYLETFTARDPDVASANTFIYKIGDDPEGWVQLDPATGKITTKKSLDRESKYVKNNMYNVTILAIDNGNPQMTGTATLNIHVTDENDNSPTLNISFIDMCQLDGAFRTNISAFDLDEEPYSGPFRFKLLGNDESMWRLEPRDRQVYSVGLVKEKTVYSGEYQLMLEVSDLQYNAAVHNITLTVCECLNPAIPNCRNRKASGSGMGVGTFGIAFLGLLLLAGVLLLAFLVSCKPEKAKFPVEIDGSGQYLMNGNTEMPGTDVIIRKIVEPHDKPTMTQVPVQIPNGTGNIAVEGAAHSKYKISEMEQWKRNYWKWQNQTSQDQWGVGGQQLIQENIWRSQNQTSQDQWGVGGQQFIRGNFCRSSTGQHQSTSSMRTTDQSRNSFMRKMKAMKYSTEYEIGVHREFLSQALNMKLLNLQTQEEELGDYAPHVYAEEEDTETRTELDAIPITDFTFDLDWDQDLDFKFNTLASICMPRKSTTYSTKTSCATENLGTATLFQTESQKTTMNKLSNIYHLRDSGYLSGESHLVIRSFSNA